MPANPDDSVYNDPAYNITSVPSWKSPPLHGAYAPNARITPRMKAGLAAGGVVLVAAGAFAWSDYAAAQAPDGHTPAAGAGQDLGQPELSIAQAVRTAITDVGTGIDAVTARAAELKPEADRSSVRREARRQIEKLPGTGLYM
jgi:hypothetical protein